MLLAVALIYKGEKVFIRKTNLDDTELSLLPEGMKESVCVIMFNSREWRSSLLSVYFSFRSACRHRLFSIVFDTAN